MNESRTDVLTQINNRMPYMIISIKMMINHPNH